MKHPIVVLGATGMIGRGVIGAAVNAGVPVVAVARDLRKLKALRGQYRGVDIETISQVIREDADGVMLAKRLREFGCPLAGVVAAMCGTPGRGRLIDQPVASLRDELDDVLMPNLSAARHLLKLLAEGDRGGHYILIGGPGSESPWAGYGPRSVAAAALSMLARVLHDEARAFDVRVQLLTVDTPANSEGETAHLCARWPSALDIGKRAINLISGKDSRLSARAVVPFQKLESPVAATDDVARSDHTHDPPNADSNRTVRRSIDDARRLLHTLTPLKNSEVSR